MLHSLIRWTIPLVALLLATSCKNEHAPINVVRDFGAVADATTDQEPVLQAALDFAAARGGGVVYLPEGVYGIARPLIIGSNVRLVGEGRGKSVLRSLVPTWEKVVQGAPVTAAVAMVAADRASISDLTVDMSHAGTDSHGVVAVPAGAQFEGTVSTRCEISNIEVIGGGNFHAYLIWNLRGRDIRIVHNVVEGGLPSYTPGSEQEGIESYGGSNVMVAWNVVRNIGNAALNFGSAGHPDTSLDGLTVIGNTVSNAGMGLNIGPALNPVGPQNVYDVLISDNNFTNIWRTGVHVPTLAGTEIRGLRIEKNRIQAVGSDTVTGTGIYFKGQLQTDTAPASAASDNTVTLNHIEDVRGPNATGVLIIRYPNVHVTENTIRNVAHSGVFATSALNLVVERNVIEDTFYHGLMSHGAPSSVYVRDNTFIEWNRGNQKVAGIAIHDAMSGEIRNNEFRHRATPPSAIRVEASAADVIVFGNVLLSETLEEQSNPNSGFVPFVNNGARSNLGLFAVAPGATEYTVQNLIVSPTSTVALIQTQGETIEASVTPDTGSFRVAFASAARGDEQFWYAIDP